MRVLNSNEIHAVSGSATQGTSAPASSTSPFTFLLVGLIWGLAALFGTGFKGIV